VKVIVFCGLIISLIAGFIPLGTLAEIVNIGTLAAFVIVSLGVIFIRKLHKSNKATFKNKWHPLIPLLGIFSCGALMFFLPHETWRRFLIWVFIGIVFYFTYSIKHSHLNKKPA
jgi:APA family basic amino acid/polyamine antiporter